MEQIAPLGPVYQAGTLSGNPIAVAAGLAQLDILERDPSLYLTLEQRGRQLREGLRALLQTYSTPGRAVQGEGSLSCLFFHPAPVSDYETAKQSDTARYARYFHYLLEHGIYLAPSQFEAIFLSAAHTPEHIDELLVAHGGIFSVPCNKKGETIWSILQTSHRLFCWAGMGQPDGLTGQALQALRDSDLILGAKRLLSLAEVLGLSVPCVPAYQAAEIRRVLQEYPQAQTISVLFSGDIGSTAVRQLRPPIWPICRDIHPVSVRRQFARLFLRQAANGLAGRLSPQPAWTGGQSSGCRGTASQNLCPNGQGTHAPVCFAGNCATQACPISRFRLGNGCRTRRNASAAGQRGNGREKPSIL